MLQQNAPDKRRQHVIFILLLTLAVSFAFAILIGSVIRSDASLSFISHPCSNSPASANLQDKNSKKFITDPVTVHLSRRKLVELHHDPVDADFPHLKSSFPSWLSHLRDLGGKRGVVTQRTVCREMAANGQTCVFEGIICMDTTKGAAPGRPNVYLVNDTMPDQMQAKTDDWCGLRNVSADPRYYSTRHWPLLQDTVVPQQSCMNASFRTSHSLFKDSVKVKWIPSMALVDLDYQDNDHNTHLAIDLLWILDALLFQDSLALKPRPGYSVQRNYDDHDGFLIPPGSTYYLPQTQRQYETQTIRDVNKLLWTLVLRKNPMNLYPGLTQTDLSHMPETPRMAISVLKAFPELLKKGQFQFHDEIIQRDDTDLVCTARLTAGVKTGFSTHERVCREIRTRAYELYGIKRPEIVRAGQIRFAQPPKKVLVINRHLTRRLGNIDQVVHDLRQRLEPFGVEVMQETTGNMNTAEEWVRIFSSAGVIISPHGSHNMGEMFMQRHSALIEIMPTGYSEHSFSLLSEPCKIWYEEVPGAIYESQREFFETECTKLTPHIFAPCGKIKAEDIWVNTTLLYPVVVKSLERLGYEMDSWLENRYKNESR